jgi:hypothetical protein
MIRIYGHSDDCICLDGDIVDEVGAYDEGRTITIGGEGEGLEVRAEYVGVWKFTLNQVDADVPVPWPIRVETEHGYSLAVVIECPPGTPVTWDGDDDQEAA